MSENKSCKVVCFGEILWDNLPNGRKPGGAPMNVAYHLNKLGLESNLISRVGNDQNGKELLDFIRSKGLSTEFCQQDDTYKTSTVEVSVGADHEVKYEIVAPVAWDFIEHESRLDDLVSKADAFVFGSLAARNQVSDQTLQGLLEKATYKVFDVNLREPHYTRSGISQLLAKASLLKLNIHELTLLSSWFSTSCQTEKERISVLQDQFNVKEILITKGASGASFYTDTDQYNYPAYKVQVNDTIGSGDSFLAAFLSQKLKNAPIEECLNYAVALGAYVTMQAGACPEYSKDDLLRFISKNELIKKQI
ncbi:MAG: carbohydrate kinase [Daejeonella sp.]